MTMMIKWSTMTLQTSVSRILLVAARKQVRRDGDQHEPRTQAAMEGVPLTQMMTGLNGEASAVQVD